MRHKSTAKNPHCQDQAETPEQRETRLLKSRLKKQESLEAKLCARYLEERGGRIKAEEQLKLAVIYKIASETLQKQHEMLIRIYKSDAEEWKTKYEAVLNNKPAEFSEAAKNSGLSDTALRIPNRMGYGATQKNEEPASGNDIRILKKTVYLICVNIGPIVVTFADGTTEECTATGLECLERYTSNKIIKYGDHNCYFINELNGDQKLCPRFVRSTQKAHFQARKK